MKSKVRSFVQNNLSALFCVLIIIAVVSIFILGNPPSAAEKEALYKAVKADSDKLRGGVRIIKGVIKTYVRHGDSYNPYMVDFRVRSGQGTGLTGWRSVASIDFKYDAAKDSGWAELSPVFEGDHMTIHVQSDDDVQYLN